MIEVMVRVCHEGKQVLVKPFSLLLENILQEDDPLFNPFQRGDIVDTFVHVDPEEDPASDQPNIMLEYSHRCIQTSEDGELIGITYWFNSVDAHCQNYGWWDRLEDLEE